MFGASGDLAKKKVYPAIFALFYEGHLPEDFVVFGYARSGMTTAEFTDKIRDSLPCRISAKGDCSEYVEKFLERCSYQAGQYDDPEDFKKLAVAMKEKEGSKKAMRVFYLSIPPSIFVPVAQNAARHVSSESGETRVIVAEKPFGRDLQSSRELTAALAADLAEENTYRIDHYLGQGAHREHHGLAVLQHHLLPFVVARAHPQRADLLLRELRHRRTGRLF